MRTFVSIFMLLLIFGTLTYAQQNTNGYDSKIWSRYMIDETHTNTYTNPEYVWEPAPQVIHTYSFDGFDAVVNPNYRVFPNANSTQSELSIDIHPTNVNILFASGNTTSWNGSSIGTLYGTGVWWTTDGGATNWLGADDPPFGRNSGDPVSIIGYNGWFYEGFIDGGSNDGGQGVAVSTDNGVTWSRHIAGAAPGGFSSLLDKNHMMVDKEPTSAYVNRWYNAWTNFSSSANDENIEFTYSTDGGVSWSSVQNISSGVNAGSHDQGVNIQTGPNGEVYVCWAIYDGWPGGEDAIGFNISTDGGASFNGEQRVYSATNFGIRGNLKPTSIRVSSFPSMAVDRSGGANNGNIYICFPQEGVAPAGSDPDIVLIRSTDGGSTFSSPVRVNDDALNNGKDQYYPWCTVDQATGHLYLVWYDSRDMSNDSAGVYMARSMDGGLTFENIKVHDQNFKPKPINGLASGYQGDYIGIAAYQNTVYPFWAEDRTGHYQAWTSKVTFGPNMAHTPLTNTENLAGPYTVEVDIESTSGLTDVKLFWGRGTSGQITDSVTMTTTEALYSADIPGDGNPYTYNYYVRATDNTGGISYLPAGAPTQVYSFVVETDVTPPTVTHTPLGDQFRETWPANVLAYATDNIGIDTVWVEYKLGTNGTTSTFFLSPNAVADSAYSGTFDNDTSGIAVGDTLFYKVIARDESAGANEGSSPTSGYYSFVFIADTDFPVITHQPLRDQAYLRWPAKVTAVVTDNIGIDEVVCEYDIENGTITGSFVLGNIGGNIYEGYFDVDTNQVSANDTVIYRIKATDISTSGNVTYEPSSGYNGFKIINTLGIVLIVNDDVTIEGRSGYDKDKGMNPAPDTKTPLGASADLFYNTLDTSGYVVTQVEWSALDTNQLFNYDLVILTAGTNTSDMFDDQGKRDAIVNYTVNNGGKTIVEGGEVGWKYRSTTGEKDINFRQEVLHDSSWVSDVSGGILVQLDPGHILFNTPHAIPDSITVDGTGFGPRDAMRLMQKPGVFKLMGWLPSYPDTAGVICYAPDESVENVRNVFLTFSVANMLTPTEEARSNFVENVANFVAMSDYIPVELTSFAATVDAGSVTLQWTTATELNNAGFHIERRSVDGEGRFSSIGYVPGKGTTLFPSYYIYTDQAVATGNYEYRLRQVDYDGTTSYSDVVSVNVDQPITYDLTQNYPNPFNPSTMIKYSLAQNGMVKLAIYNVLGERVATLVNEVQKAGRYEVKFDAAQFSSGIYFYRLESGDFTAVKKMILMK